MGMKMKMMGSSDIEMGSDLTPSLRPLSYSLYDSFLDSHCSSCFSPLSSSSSSPRIYHNAPPPLYCSPLCSSASASHSSSGEIHLPSHPSSADLRAALRFLLLLDRHPLLLHRLAGLLTNYQRLFMDGDDEIVTRIRSGATALALARTRRDGVHLSEEAPTLELAVLCLVVTNAVEVQDSSSGRALGIALYDFRFSWINHSCSPNACYRFLFSGPSSSSSSSSSSSNGETSLKILPSQIGESDCGHVQLIEGCEEYGPRVIVRSIKRITKGEEVTVTYTDLLVPKAMRQSDLWLKYRFVCHCRRCSVLPLAYVDHALQEICSYHSNLSSKNSLLRDEAGEMLDDWISNAISEYLSDGDPESCCKKLESILTLGIHDVKLGSKEGNPQIKFRLYPLHHLSLSAYTTLASVHRLCANDLLTHDSNTDKLEGFRMSRASAAYSLLLGGATHHLFQSESSLIASVANFWTNAGESLLTLARSSAWSLLGTPDMPVASHSSFAKHKCSKCSLMDKFEESLHSRQAQIADFEEITEEFLSCIRNFTHQVWIFLVHKCHYLEGIKDPIDFSWLETTKYLCLAGVDSISRTEACNSRFEIPGNAAEVRISIYKLGFHCSLYGALLSNMYYGQHSHLLSHIQDILNLENNETD